MPYSTRMRRGFTLIELLVVISIISLLTSVVLTSVQQARATARNAQRNSVVSQYKLALELAYDAGNNAFPDSSSNYACLGTYQGNTCWTNAYSNSSVVDTALTGFINGKPAPDSTGLVYNGVLYYRLSPSTYLLLWFLEGVNRDCSPGTVYFPNYAGYGQTYCRFDR